MDNIIPEDLEEKEIQEEKGRRQEYQKEIRLAILSLLIGLLIILFIILVALFGP